MQFEYISRRVAIFTRGTYFYATRISNIIIKLKIRPITYYATLREFRWIVYVLYGMLIPKLVNVLLLFENRPAVL